MYGGAILPRLICQLSRALVKFDFTNFQLCEDQRFIGISRLGPLKLKFFRAVVVHSLAFAPLVSHLFQVTHQMVVVMMKTHGVGMVNAKLSGRMGHMQCRK